MGRYAVEDVHVAFGDPDRGYWLHRLAPRAISPDSTRTLCGRVVVKGIDERVSESDWPKATRCPDCIEVHALCDTLDLTEEEHEVPPEQVRRMVQARKRTPRRSRRPLRRATDRSPTR